MLITVTGFKGGIAKSVSSLHLARFFHDHEPTLLVDGDLNRSVLQWSRKGHLPFPVVDEREVARHARKYETIIADTAARPDKADLEALARGCDLMVLPTTPESMSIAALMQTVQALRDIGVDTPYRVLLTIVPPPPSKDGQDARQALEDAGLPLFRVGIRQAAAFRKASLYGVTVREVDDPRAAACWGDYKAVGEEILDAIG